MNKMKYSKEFFIFKAINQNELMQNDDNPFLTEIWIKGSDTANFICYSYYWLKKEEDNYKVEFKEANIWFDIHKEVIVIFQENMLLIEDILKAISRKFGYVCEP